MQVKNPISIEGNSENTVLIVWPERVCQHQHQWITDYQQLIKLQLKHYIVETISSYNSLLVYYKFELIAYKPFSDQLHYLWRSLSKVASTVTKSAVQRIEIPVYYGLEAGWDLPYLSQVLDLTAEQIIEYHSDAVYRAYSLGFTPGFCYLATLTPFLQVARRSSPRLTIPQGAVAIAGQQTAVYPSASPGGWHIIGQTPMAMFEITEQCFSPAITPGQQVTFKAIDYSEYCRLGGIISLENHE